MAAINEMHRDGFPPDFATLLTYVNSQVSTFERTLMKAKDSDFDQESTKLASKSSSSGQVSSILVPKLSNLALESSNLKVESRELSQDSIDQVLSPSSPLSVEDLNALNQESSELMSECAKQMPAFLSTLRGPLYFWPKKIAKSTEKKQQDVETKTGDKM